MGAERHVPRRATPLPPLSRRRRAAARGRRRRCAFARAGARGEASGERATRETAMTVVGVVQARMASTRLPGKVLRDIAGAPMLSRVVGRLARAASVDAVVVATSTAPSDAVIAEYCAANDIRCFRG